MKTILNLRVIYIVIAYMLVIGVWNLFYHDALAKWVVVFALAWLAVQSCSATYWSYRWQQSAIEWQAIAKDTSDKLLTMIAELQRENDHLREPWRN